MKYMRPLIFISLFAASATQAAFKMPKKVYRWQEKEQAVAKAMERNRPLAVILTTEESSCGLCAAASIQMANGLLRRCEVLYYNTRDDWQGLPPKVRTALTAPEIGRVIPRAVVTDHKFEEIFASLPYARGDELDRLLRTTLRELPKLEATPADLKPPTPVPKEPQPAAKVPGPGPHYTIEPEVGRGSRTWKSIYGATVEAALVHERNNRVTLEKSDGAKVEIVLNDLSREDQEYLKPFRSKPQQ